MEYDWSEILAWFDLNKNSTLEISKEEDGDLDFTQLKLEDADFIKHNDTDDYLAEQAILIRGIGSVNTAEGWTELPFAEFELALTDWWEHQIAGDTLYIQTERGNYTINVKKEA